MVFTTERLQLRWPSTDDAHFYYRLMNQESWKIFIGNREIDSLSDAKNYIEDKILPHFHQWNMGFYTVSILESQSPIGICGIIHRDGLSYPDLGFALLDEYVGKGYLYEAAQEILKQTHVKHPKIDAITMNENTRSKNLLIKLGFENCGTVQLKGEQEPLMLFRKVSGKKL